MKRLVVEPRLTRQPGFSPMSEAGVFSAKPMKIDPHPDLAPPADGRASKQAARARARAKQRGQR